MQSCIREMLNFPTNQNFPFQLLLYVFSGFQCNRILKCCLFFWYYFPCAGPYFLTFLSACWPAGTNPVRLRWGRQMGLCSTFSSCCGCKALPAHPEHRLTQALRVWWNSGRDPSSMRTAQIFVCPAASRTGRSPGHPVYSTAQHHSDGFVVDHADNPIVLYKGFGHPYMLSCEMVPFSHLPSLN